MLLPKMQRDRQIWSIYLDQSHLTLRSARIQIKYLLNNLNNFSIKKDVTDCFIEFLQNTNVREREYLKEHEFLLNFG